MAGNQERPRKCGIRAEDFYSVEVQYGLNLPNGETVVSKEIGAIPNGAKRTVTVVAEAECPTCRTYFEQNYPNSKFVCVRSTNTQEVNSKDDMQAATGGFGANQLPEQNFSVIAAAGRLRVKTCPLLNMLDGGPYNENYVIVATPKRAR